MRMLITKSTWIESCTIPTPSIQSAVCTQSTGGGYIGWPSMAIIQTATYGSENFLTLNATGIEVSTTATARDTAGVTTKTTSNVAGGAPSTYSGSQVQTAPSSASSAVKNGAMSCMKLGGMLVGVVVGYLALVIVGDVRVIVGS